MPVKFTAKAHMVGPPKYSLEESPALPETDQGDHEPLFQIKDFPQNYVKYHAHKNTAGTRKARHHNVVHLSDLDPARNWCPREPALLTMHNKSRPQEYLGTAMQVTHRFGYKGADLLIEMLPPSMVWGHWKCRGCGHVTMYSYTPVKCPSCHADRPALRYKEVFFRNPETGIVGSVDLFVDLLSSGIRTGVEIKTEGNATFKARLKPTFDHEWRSMGYLWLMATSPQGKGHNLNLKEMRVVYLTKEGWAADPQIKEWGLKDSAKSSMKEYWVLRGDDMIENRLQLANSYRQWRNTWDAAVNATGEPPKHPPALPPRIEKCTGMFCSRAKFCPVAKECWGL